MVSEIIREFDRKFEGDGRAWRVVAVGQPTTTGQWSGWIEFQSPRGEVRRTAQETTQPDRGALRSWARGIDSGYLEGPFRRARQSSRKG